ncbi:MAG: hypothetical protein JWN37_66 [Candidatus Nomurabacteria bacterium]|nr:hypothetical protein [Candidatus Nomurabacteria bacterium]
MNRLIMAVGMLFLCSYFLSYDHVFAHEVKYDGTISAFLHINPNDDPKAEENSELLILLSDSRGFFNSNNCDCSLSVTDGGKDILNTKIFLKGESSATVHEVFPHAGIYQISVRGVPKSGGDFKAFNIIFDKRVEGANNQDSAPKYEIYLIIAALLLIAFLFIYNRRHK